MSEIADFLRNRWAEARAAELAKRRSIPSAFDGHDVEVRHERDMPAEVLIDGHPYAAEKYLAVATEPAPDPHVIADLDAKLALIDDLLAERHEVVDGDCWYTCAAATEEHDGGETCDDDRRGRPCDCGRDARVGRLLAILAQPFAGHPDHKGEEWTP
ncbi:hypothetical protein GCM10009837_07480 [Streptomyces durmitorensis]|uniref:DUF6221 family protein n=1 Tax=Streptomyces durmitorensis TaxID=319947 RepID=A0ABY4PKX4_9ACTN|nr:DUF6221 family protein [Streptomyces durmitorensis]UQT54361.1 DUF6221 family protein [Streptomyces durmitorensis]